MNKLPYASFTRRASARFIDFCVVFLACMTFYLVDRALGFPLKFSALFNWQPPESASMFMSNNFPGIFTIFVAVKLPVSYPYFALMECSRWQGTLGKQVMRIKVTDINGKRISFGRATGRYFLKIISSIELMLGYLICFSDQRQTIHDYLSQVLVVRKEIVFSEYYVMPRVSSRFMFEVPFVSRQSSDGSGWSGYECVWCNYRGMEKSVACPSCGRLGYPPVGGVKGMLLMVGLIFTVIGSGLAYVSFWVVRDRLIDDSLGREGAPWTVISIIVFACVMCLFLGLSSILGKKWLLRLMLGIGLGLSPKSMRDKPASQR